SALAQQTLDDAFVAPALRRKRPEPEALMAFLAEAHSHGVEIDWAKLFEGGQLVDLPTYAFQRKRYWLDRPAGAGDASALGLGASGHAVLGGELRVAGQDEWVFTGRISQTTHAWVADHVLLDRVVVPGTALVDMAL